jgi:hypothetical protein
MARIWKASPAGNKASPTALYLPPLTPPRHPRSLWLRTGCVRPDRAGGAQGDDSGQTWHHTDEKLLDIISRGGQAVYGDENFKSSMPAFGGMLNDSDLAAILDFIKSQWSKTHQDYQWWITARGRSS